MASFPSSVEAWRPLVAQYAGDIPVDFLLAWIQQESGGNPCATGIIQDGISIENGLFQLMSPGNTDAAGVTLEQLRAPCAGPTSDAQARPLTADERALQVSSGVRYVQAEREATRQALTAVGASWPETSGDFWAMVKSRHGLPAIAADLLPAVAQRLGRGPSSWAEFVNTYTQMGQSEIPSSLTRFFLSASRHGYRNRLDDILANADKVGRLAGAELSSEGVHLPWSGTKKFLVGFGAVAAFLVVTYGAVRLGRHFALKPMVLGAPRRRRRRLPVDEAARDMIRRFGDRAGRIARNREDDALTAETQYYWERVVEAILRLEGRA